MRCRTPDDRSRGSITAEFAAVVPAVVLVLLFALGAMQLAGEQLRLQAAVAQVARQLGRGETVDDRFVQQVSAGAVVTSSDDGDLVCAQARAPAALGILTGITLTASSCALADGQ